MNKPLLSNQRIIDCLKTNYGVEVVALTLLPLGADMDASAYKAEAQGETSFFVKLKRGHHHDIGITIVGLLHQAGVKEIIPPINTTHGKPTQRIDDFTLIMYPFIEGYDGFNHPLTDEQWLILGRTLRQVHEIDVPSSIQRQVRREAYSPKWREMVRLLYAHIEAKSDGNELALKLSAFMKENTLVIHRP